MPFTVVRKAEEKKESRLHRRKEAGKSTAQDPETGKAAETAQKPKTENAGGVTKSFQGGSRGEFKRGEFKRASFVRVVTLKRCVEEIRQSGCHLRA